MDGWEKVLIGLAIVGLIAVVSMPHRKPMQAGGDEATTDNPDPEVVGMSPALNANASGPWQLMANMPYMVPPVLLGMQMPATSNAAGPVGAELPCQGC